jgi:hypothetical protein
VVGRSRYLRLRGGPCLRSQELGQDPEAIGERVLTAARLAMQNRAAAWMLQSSPFSAGRRRGWRRPSRARRLAAPERRKSLPERTGRLVRYSRSPPCPAMTCDAVHSPCSIGASCSKAALGRPLPSGLLGWGETVRRQAWWAVPTRANPDPHAPPAVRFSRSRSSSLLSALFSSSFYSHSRSPALTVLDAVRPPSCLSLSFIVWPIRIPFIPLGSITLLRLHPR